MFLGTSVYTFEGTAMIIPIQSSMKHPEQLPRLLSWSMLAITLTFTVFGATSFYAYRSDTRDIILENLPDEGYFVVTAMFCVVALLMFPLMLFPASQVSIAFMVVVNNLCSQPFIITDRRTAVL